MKRILCFLFTILFALSLKAQTSQTEPQKILDNASAAIRTGGGIKVDFIVKMFDESRLLEEMQGSIQLREEKILLKTDDTVIWFDGKTQWSYWAETEEVNVTTPTREELQSISPYVLLSAYQKGFECQKGSKTLFQGKPINEVLLTAAANNRQDILRARLYILKETYQLVFIELEQQGGSRSEITVTGYQTKKTTMMPCFGLVQKEYPNAEIIDLR